MNYAKTTGKTIQQSFEDYHNENPAMYAKFKELAFMAINRGKEKISFKLITNVIRWEHYINTVEPTQLILNGLETKFKVNDAYSSRYARLFISDYPEHANKIEFRELRS